MEGHFTDYLIEKPLTLIYWAVSIPFNISLEFFEDTELKEISSVEELDYWLKVGDVKNILIATSNEQELKSIKSFLDKLLPEKRRELFVILIAPNVKTFDPVQTFVYSVNLLINLDDLSYFPQLYNKAKLYWEQLYKGYKKVLTKVMEEL